MSANQGWNILNFRAGLVRALIADGHEVIAAAGDDGTFPKLRQLGVRPIALPIDGAELNATISKGVVWRWRTATCISTSGSARSGSAPNTRR